MPRKKTPLLDAAEVSLFTPVWWRDQLKNTLCNAYPKTPSAEHIEMMAQALHKFTSPRDWFEIQPEEMDYRRRQAFAAYRGQPLWQELWGGVD